MSGARSDPPAGRSVFRGRLLDVRVETAEFPDGSTGELEIVRHPGAAAVLPLVRPEERCDAGTSVGVILLRQYRYAVGGVIWEVPAGKLDGDESPDDCARRELLEETGIAARRLERLTTLMTTPGFTDERVHLYLATGLTFGASDREAQEFIEIRTLDLAVALAMVDRGEIGDAKTVACLLLAARRLGDD
ncbi:MAG TPA: NUDIX hydrolase [Gemmatimonadota bacterium]|nr:NUDIX hydrolase [Gemmatimonadota bacterium]